VLPAGLISYPDLQREALRKGPTHDVITWK